MVWVEPSIQSVEIQVRLKGSLVLGSIQRHFFKRKKGKDVIVDQLNDREEKIGNAIYIELKDIVSILVETNVRNLVQRSEKN